MKVIENQVFNNLEKAITEADQDLLIIKNVTVNAVELNPASTTSLYGADLRRCKTVEIENFTFKATALKRKYAYGIRLGYANTPTDANGLVKMKNSMIQGLGPASSDYNTANRDGIALEGGELWLKDGLISDVSDACVDCKGNLKAKSMVFNGGYREIRIWPGKTVILSNCKVGTVWFENNTGKLILYNTPMPTLETNSGTPATAQVVVTDPLTDPWFGSKFAKLISLQEKQVALDIEFLNAYKEL